MNMMLVPNLWYFKVKLAIYCYDIQHLSAYSKQSAIIVFTPDSLHTALEVSVSYLQTYRTLVTLGSVQKTETLKNAVLNLLDRGCQTHCHRGPHQPRGCLRRAEIILGPCTCNYFYKERLYEPKPVS